MAEITVYGAGVCEPSMDKEKEKWFICSQKEKLHIQKLLIQIEIMKIYRP